MPKPLEIKAFRLFQHTKRNPLQSNSAAGFVFLKTVAFCSVVIVKPPSSDHSSVRSAINLTSLTASAS